MRDWVFQESNGQPENEPNTPSRTEKCNIFKKKQKTRNCSNQLTSKFAVRNRLKKMVNL